MNLVSSDRFEAISRINQTCDCVPLQLPHARCTESSTEASGAGLFANTPVFISQNDQARITAIIQAIDRLSSLPGYRAHCESRDRTSSRAVESKQIPRDNTIGIVSGFDFHLSPTGPRLIEVNTNAGGAFIAQNMIASHNLDLAPNKDLCLSHPFGNAGEIANRLRSMVRCEWHKAGRSTSSPAHLAIVDENPANQFLFNDMTLAQDLLERQSMAVSIIDAAELHYRDGTLLYGTRPVDFIYNRLTDFELLSHPAIRQAWLDDSVVLSPSPRHHRLLADKRNLALFADRHALGRFGLDEPSIKALAAVPDTIVLDSANADYFWQHRKRYYFKPASGYASRAVYRGSKITRRVWNEITAGDYVAQQQVTPTSRRKRGDKDAVALKFDIRSYAYNGQTIALVARMYQGQTTNFRTPGGGFAPVAVLPDWACSSSEVCC